MRSMREAVIAEALQNAANEIAALRLMSYTGGQADMGEDEIRRLRELVIDLSILLAQVEGVKLPEAEVIL